MGNNARAVQGKKGRGHGTGSGAGRDESLMLARSIRASMKNRGTGVASG
jgi:hypothetical protein